MGISTCTILAVAWPLTFYPLQTLLILFSMSLDPPMLKATPWTLCLYTPPSNLMFHKRFVNQDVALKFSNLLDRHVISGCTDADVATQCFNNHCLEILNSVAPMKSVIAAPKRAHPWINDDIRKVKIICRKVERLWKSTKLGVHRLHLRELWVSLHETIKTARSG